MLIPLLVTICLSLAPQASAQHEGHDQHRADMDHRGNEAMGFDQAKITHTFTTDERGGAIQVVARDAADAASVSQIRTHLREITKLFKGGDFSKPVFIHAQTPPGIDVLKARRAEIDYRFQEIPAGAKVTISSSNSEAIDAVHAFLRFQQGEHQSPRTSPAGGDATPRYQMITYQLVMLRKGPAAATAGTPEGQKIVQAHVAHIYKLGADGVGMAAGPFTDDGDIQGVIIMKVPSAERAREIEAADPAVKAGIFVVEAASFLSPDGWFGKWAEIGQFEELHFGFLNSGPTRGQDQDTARRLQSEHLAYMEGQAKEGKLVLAGPFTAEGVRRGIVVYRVADASEAKRRAEADPIVKAGRLAVELHPWQVPLGALPPMPR